MTGNVQAAYAACERTARAHYENFPVASVLVPSRMRHHIAALYAFARAADDFADEGDLAPETRLTLLDGWEGRLHAAVRGEDLGPARPGEPAEAPQVFVAVGASIRTLQLPVSSFTDLLSAFRQDVTVRRYGTWRDVIDYCRRSANPVGRLVLRIAGHAEPRFDDWSDALCTALQLTNFWQDLHADYARGRIYLPAETLEAHGATAHDFTASPAPPALQAALASAVTRTRALFVAGRPLCTHVPGRLGYELRATWLGGMRILDRVESQRGTSFGGRPTLSLGDAPWLAWHALAWNLTSSR